MNLKTLGLINNRIAVGVNTATGNIFIHGSSNCLEMSNEELTTMITVLIVAQRLPHEFAGTFLNTHAGFPFCMMWKPFTEETKLPQGDCKGCE